MEKQEIILHISHLDVGYPGAPELIQDANGSLIKGEITALVGRNGTGKSTLLKTISGFIKPASGKISLYNTPIHNYQTRDLARILSFVGTSSGSVEDMTVFELVSLGRHPYTNWWGSLKGEDRKIILRSLDFVGMSGYLDVNVNRLSDGEKQRVMIARSLAQDTPLIILDEPTAYLDIPNKISVVEVLNRLKEAGKSVLFSTHDFDSVFQFADKVWVLHDKRIIEGSPEDLGLSGIFGNLFSDNGVVFDFLEARFKKHSPSGREARISCSDNMILSWTSRMLGRLGFQVIESKNPDIMLVTVIKDEDQVTWKLNYSCNEYSFQSLYDLAGFLTLA